MNVNIRKITAVIVILFLIYSGFNYVWCNSLSKEIENNRTQRALEMIDENHIFSLNLCTSPIFFIPYSAEWVPESPLMKACEKENYKVVEKLISNGADVNRGAFLTDYNPVQSAIDNCDENNYKEFESIFRLLVNNGLDINRRDSSGDNVVLQLSKISPWEISKSVNDNKLIYNDDIASKITSLIASLYSKLEYEDYVNTKSDETILFVATYMGNISLVEYAINNLKLSVNDTDRFGRTAIIGVYNDANGEKIAYILKNAGADISMTESECGLRADEYLRTIGEDEMADYISLLFQE